jgi:hypothetical protein
MRNIHNSDALLVIIEMGSWNVSEMEHKEQFVLLPNGNGESVFGESRARQRMLW